MGVLCFARGRVGPPSRNSQANFRVCKTVVLDKVVHLSYTGWMKKPYIPGKGTARRAIGERFLYLHKYKSDRGCVECGEKDPFVLEFDHIGEREKKDHVSVMASAPHLYSVGDLLDEVSKCRILCCNCHRRRTQKNRNSLARYAGIEYVDIAVHGDSLQGQRHTPRSTKREAYLKGKRVRKDASTFYH